ncbi:MULTISPECIES: HNH endonuclease family protein [Streptomyces]|uniref:HNH endonuclease n=1 Tax=Streptomyces lycii TaxID=2654337 RepID=A0ABQ7FCT0_9ACTN|nr:MULTISPECIES: HNH endonuclease family protein [Streptomyces]KAF4405514.1 HNH endonuclease [Streptomyces lycii]PGH47086.1 hypothetical protein CRI70_30465 [Streptomyces sp. Ru87]
MSRTRSTTSPRTIYARRIGLAGGLAALAGTVLLSGPAAQAEPPTPPSASTALTQLNGLTVETEGSGDGYSRDRFPHWSSQGDSCNTREVVLKRDGENVEQDGSCAATGGTWRSAYDDGVWTQASDVDIDHVVPLSEAWKSGADAWTDTEREGFANDLTHAQLIAVTDNVNQSKGDQDPAEWMPPNTGYHCMYARMWVSVKDAYDLSVDSAEKSTLGDVLSGC